MSSKQRMAIMGAAHNDIKYLQNDDIGGRLREQRESNRSAQNLLDEFRKMLNNHRESDNVYPPRNRRSNNNR